MTQNILQPPNISVWNIWIEWKLERRWYSWILNPQQKVLQKPLLSFGVLFEGKRREADVDWLRFENRFEMYIHCIIPMKQLLLDSHLIILIWSNIIWFYSIRFQAAGSQPSDFPGKAGLGRLNLVGGKRNRFLVLTLLACCCCWRWSSFLPPATVNALNSNSNTNTNTNTNSISSRKKLSSTVDLGLVWSFPPSFLWWNFSHKAKLKQCHVLSTVSCAF